MSPPRIHRISALLWVVAGALHALPAAADEVATGTFVHVDSNDTLVVNPHLRGQLDIGDATSVNVEYGVDVWTSASVDIVTSASPHAVTEQRDELNASATHLFGDVGVTVGYRFSTEHDYVSQGGSATVSWDFAQKNSTLAATVYGSIDEVGRAGDPTFARGVNNYGIRPSFTQILDRNTLMQFTYELSASNGYLSSPYRRVGVGGDGLCNQTAVICVEESNPEARTRHAAAVSLRHAFGEQTSMGGMYRFYLDDWGLLSNTLSVDLQYLPREGVQLGVRYRGYMQTAADHYRSVYEVPQAYMTRDKELGPLTSHRISLELSKTWELADLRALNLLLSFAPVFYRYSDFIPLSRITAMQTNLALVLEL